MLWVDVYREIALCLCKLDVETIFHLYSGLCENYKKREYLHPFMFMGNLARYYKSLRINVLDEVLRKLSPSCPSLGAYSAHSISWDGFVTYSGFYQDLCALDDYLINVCGYNDQDLHNIFCDFLSFSSGTWSSKITSWPPNLNNFLNYFNGKGNYQKIVSLILYLSCPDFYLPIPSVLGRNNKVRSCLNTLWPESSSGNFADDYLNYLKNYWKRYGKPLYELINLDEKLANLLERFKNLILYGPPGTGKTYLAKRIAAKILGLDPKAGVDRKHPQANDFQKARFGSSTKSSKAQGEWMLIQFHPSYGYEDFVRGITVTTSDDHINYKVVDRVFVEMCRKAEQNPDGKYVLIIDEINRADLSRVLGELIYALEYRGEPVELLYTGSRDTDSRDTGSGVNSTLTVPENLYIIGTMNTADRSIGYLDYAVRRRFVFKKLPPSKDELLNYYKENEKVVNLAKHLFAQVTKIFKDKRCLSPDYTADEVQPGHTYFMAKDEEELWLKFCYQVWPLLQEYIRDGVLLCRQCDEECALNPRKGADDCETINLEDLKLGRELEKKGSGSGPSEGGGSSEGTNQPEEASPKGAEE